MVRYYSKKRYRRHRSSVWKRIKRLEKAAINPWATTKSLYGGNIQSAQNRYGWSQQVWGQGSHWQELWTRAPLTIAQSAAPLTSAGGTGGQVNDSDPKILKTSTYPSADNWGSATASTGIASNLMLHVIVQHKFTIVNNQDYPVTLVIYKGYCRENMQLSPLDCLDRAIFQATNTSTALAINTLLKEDLTFQFSDLERDNVFKDNWKIKQRQALKLNPGDVCKFTNTINARANGSDLRMFDTTSGYISGRAMYTMFKIMGPIGKDNTGYGSTATDNPGILGANLQLTLLETKKCRFESTGIPPIKNINLPLIQPFGVPPTSNQLQPDGLTTLSAVYPTGSAYTAPH